MERKEDHNVAKVRPQNPVWDPRLKLDGATIPKNSFIREFQKGQAHYLTKALEQSLLLLKDMAALRNIRQPGLFLSLKRGLALVSLHAFFTTIKQGRSFFFFFFLSNNILVCYFYAGRPKGLHG